MKLEDIIALAKQGYKPADIRELVSLADVPEQADQLEKPQGDNSQLDDAESVHTTIDDKPTESANVIDDAIDYKALFEESQKQLKLAQEANIKKDMSDSASSMSDADILGDLVKSFM